MTTSSRSPQPAPIDTAVLKRQTNLLTLVGSPLQRIAGTQGGEYAGPCPFCGGTDRFHVQPNRPDGGLWMCRECTEGRWADAIAFVMRRDDVPFPEAVRRLGGPPPAPAKPPGPPALPARRKPGPVVATYAYRDERGDLLFQVLRHHPKDFTQRRPDGRGGWIYRLEDTRRVLYNLPKVAAAPPEEPIWVCEGEKDADRLIAGGLVATTNPHGAKKWRPEYTATLAGRSVVLVPHHDPPGLAHAAEITAALAPVTDRVKVLTLPDLPPGGKDVSDWLDAGHTLDELLALAKATPRVAAPPAADDGPPPPLPPRPVIRVDRPATEVAAAIIATLDRANGTAPVVFQQGRALVRVIDSYTGDTVIPIIDPFTPDNLRPHIGTLARVVKWVTSKGGDVDTDASREQLAAVLTAPAWPFPVLEGMSEVPIVRPDGSIQDTPGYDRLTRYVYRPAPGVIIPPIAATPTPEEIAAARALLVDDLFADFPFTGDAERAHAVALLLLPFVRPLIAGPSPVHLIESPTPGTGKSLLVKAALTPALGNRLEGGQDKRDEDEMRKWITTRLAAGAPALWMDNIKQGLDSATLANATTQEMWEDRLLGTNTPFRAPVRAVWVATANNPILSTEMARRVLRVRLDAGVDQPQFRTGFKHRDILSWVYERRGDLIHAALTLVRAWVVAGRPIGGQTFGSYQHYADVMGGILTAAQIPGFLTNAVEVYELSDTDSARWKELVSAWWEQYKSRPVISKDLFELTGKVEGFDYSSLGGPVQFGIDLAKQRDRIYNGYRIARLPKKYHNAWQWALLPVGSSPGEEDGRVGGFTRVSIPIREQNTGDDHDHAIRIGEKPYQTLPTLPLSPCVCGDTNWYTDEATGGAFCGSCLTLAPEVP